MSNSNESIEARVDRIETHLALTKLINRYHRCADSFDWKGWSECFTEDSVYDLTASFGLMKGRQQIHDICKGNMDAVLEDMQHILVNLDFEITGPNTATGTANCIFATVPDAKKRSENYVSGGRYRWEFRRESTGWQISKTIADRVWNIGTGTGGAFNRVKTSAKTS